MRTVVTGAAGFLGRALARRMEEVGYPGDVVLADRTASPSPQGVAIDLTERAALAALVEGADRVIHLAALPGGAAEADPEGSRAINLGLTLDLLDILSRRSHPARLVCAGSIAVFGAQLPDAIDDATPVRPSMTYGAHKAMVELAIADRVRRGEVEAMALRLPGLIARPDGTGFGSAFLSGLFVALLAGERFTMPVGPDATTWLMSAERCADNLLAAASMTFSAGDCVLTLPALRLDARTLVAAAARATRADPALVTYAPDAKVEAQFGSLPPLLTPAADRLGFRHDGDADSLARRALNGLRAS